MRLPPPVCADCSVDIEPFNLEGLCEDCYTVSHCEYCDIEIERGADCELCGKDWENVS